MAVHPSPEIIPAVVDKIVARRHRLHAHPTLDPRRTALVVVDLDAGSCARDPERTSRVFAPLNQLAAALRSAGGVVAFATSAIGDPGGLAARLGDELAGGYVEDTRPGGAGTRLADGIDVDPSDIHVTKLGASAFFPGRCDLHERLQPFGIRSVLVAGLVTNVCCESTARDAVELGYEVTMVSDLNVGHDWGLHEASLTTFFRTFGDVRPTSDVLTLIARR